MKRKKLLYFTIPSLIEAYKDKFPEIVQMAVVSDTLKQFNCLLSVYVYQLAQSRRASLPKNKPVRKLPFHAAAKRIHQMLMFEGREIKDFVTTNIKEIR